MKAKKAICVATLLVPTLFGMGACQQRLQGNAPSLPAAPQPHVPTQWVRAFVVDGKPLGYRSTQICRGSDGSYWILWLDEATSQLCLCRSQDSTEWHGKTVLDTFPPELRQTRPQHAPEKYFPLGSFRLSADSRGGVVVACEVFNDPGVFKDRVLCFYRRSADGAVEQHTISPADLLGKAVEHWNWCFCCGAKGGYLLATWVPGPSGEAKDKSQVWKSNDLEHWEAIGMIPAGIRSLFALGGSETGFAAVSGDSLFHSRDGRNWSRAEPPAGELLAVVADQEGEYWALSRSVGLGHYGACWLSKSSDLQHWSKPLLTPVQAAGVRCLLSEAGGNFLVAAYGGQAAGLCSFTEGDLRRDSDRDGLTDVQEYRMMTNPEAADTDGDGTPDGKDRNPLAAPHPLSPVQEIRAAVLKTLMERESPSGDMAIFLCNGPQDRQEFQGLRPVILCLTPDERSEYDKRFGLMGIWAGQMKDVIIAEDEQSATANCEYYYSGTAGAGWLAKLRKVGGQWQFEGWKGGWIS
jgi:hypothetical protein